MIIEILLILPLYVLLFIGIFKFRHIINTLIMVDNIISLQDKREFLRKMIEDGKASEIPSRGEFTEEKLLKADRKTIHSLYGKITGSEPVKPKLSKDALSQLTGMKDFNKLLADIHENPLLSTNQSNFEIPTMPNPADIIGSHIYEKFHPILKPIAMFSILFSNMDWARFAAISEERQKITMKSQNPGESSYFEEQASIPPLQKLEEDRSLDNIISFGQDSE